MSAELEGLAGLVAEADATAAPPETGVADAAAIEEHARSLRDEQTEALARELGMIVSMTVGVLSPALPSLKEIYTDQATEQASRVTAAALVKHGIGGTGLLDRWGEEIACALVMIPLGIATVRGVRGDVENLKARKLRKPANPDPVAQDVSHTHAAESEGGEP